MKGSVQGSGGYIKLLGMREYRKVTAGNPELRNKSHLLIAASHHPLDMRGTDSIMSTSQHFRKSDSYSLLKIIYLQTTLQIVILNTFLSIYKKYCNFNLQLHSLKWSKLSYSS